MQENATYDNKRIEDHRCNDVQIAYEKRKQSIKQLRKQGMTFGKLGEMFGITRQRAHQIWLEE